MGKTVIITGTSRGIGFEMVKIFSELGHRVIALSRNQTPVVGLGLEEVEAFSFDLSDAGHQEVLRSYLERNDIKVDVLINNAGMLVNKPFEEITNAEWQAVYEVNVFGVAATIRTVLPFFNEGGHVVTVSSMGGVQGSMKFPGLAAYSSAKGAVITMTELLAEEYKDKGPSFNVLALGAVQTEMLEEAFPGYVAPVTAQEMAAYIADFALTGNKLYNGKLLQVSNSTP
ncbi:SDR family NAD(P)-dependent oxidoreductase [Robertkochia sediminum]|uniref:SDR family NAD(P)-dependent oxidoreductase n=1 Tax=Robertkochia sediminum TaxID=2785326 RepID=UPI0019337112|nr:SDR family NAD(P)-dependent oxidoreductase [Robertkochia sediminum]MBL7472856.1 SDR family NAD(P)-dependent oxidoreductase [Robertkochia sediminum]